MTDEHNDQSPPLTAAESDECDVRAGIHRGTCELCVGSVSLDDDDATKDPLERLIPPDVDPLDALADFLSNCVDDAEDWEDREDLNTFTGVYGRLRDAAAPLSEALQADLISLRAVMPVIEGSGSRSTTIEVPMLRRMFDALIERGDR